ncbi:hypothetical protein [Citricoccus sp. GCM10030269]|uniref:hypothetical protein n=1 Tax=Citricoccus sp. GCM10030269 TaxID=3273388 RepID=UPI0036132067
MAWFMFLVFAPLVAGVILALVWWVLRGRASEQPDSRTRLISLAAGLLLFLGGLAERFLGSPILIRLDIPSVLMGWYADYHYIAPLVLGILGLALLAFPAHARPGQGTATLAPRTPTSFGRAWWFVTAGAVAGLVVLITVITGLASEPDSTGRYMVYSVEVGGQYGMGTSIYGWFYSIPALVLLVLMIVVVVIDLYLISRPALEGDHIRDAHVRTLRTRNVLAVASGALLIHLGLILRSLAGTAGMQGQFTIDGGMVTSWTTFAALQPVLIGAGALTLALGFGLWATVPLSVLSRRRPASVTPS